MAENSSTSLAPAPTKAEVTNGMKGRLGASSAVRILLASPVRSVPVTDHSTASTGLLSMPSERFEVSGEKTVELSPYREVSASWSASVGFPRFTRTDYGGCMLDYQRCIGFTIILV